MAFNLKFFLFLWIIPFVSTAATSSVDSTLNVDNLQASPAVISPTGQGKLREHLEILGKNIQITENNLASTKKNLGVINAEIQDLNQLEKEHLALKERYLGFLANAQGESRKNDKALSEITEFETRAEKIIKSNENTAQVEELKTAQEEKRQRLNWKAETDDKTRHTKELLAGIEKNLENIRGKRATLEEQVQVWNKKQNEYSELLMKLTLKKKKAERFLASKNPTDITQ
jgi:chromosome segregation ATPase